MALLATPKTKIAFFEFTGTMFLAYGVVCSSIKGYPSDFFVSCSLYLAIGWASDFSGAHFNPAVSLALYLHNKYDYLWLYLVSQVLGALAGVFGAYLLTEETLLPVEDGLTVSMYVHYACKEIVGAFLFCHSVLLVANKNTSFTCKPQYVQVFVPTALFVCRFLADNVGINPAVDLAALVAHAVFKGGNLSSFWIGVASPLVGGAVGGLFHKLAYEPSVCLSREEDRVKKVG